jgi:hypothetical protein
MPNSVGGNQAKRKLAAGELTLFMGVNQMRTPNIAMIASTEMGIPGRYQHARMRAAFETTARAARSHGKSFGVGGVREDLEFQTWLLQIGMRYLTGGSDVGYILSAGRADVKRIRAVPLGSG